MRTAVPNRLKLSFWKRPSLGSKPQAWEAVRPSSTVPGTKVLASLRSELVQTKMILPVATAVMFTDPSYVCLQYEKVLIYTEVTKNKSKTLKKQLKKG